MKPTVVAHVRFVVKRGRCSTYFSGYRAAIAYHLAVLGSCMFTVKCS